MFLIENDLNLYLLGLHNPETMGFINSATVEGTLLEGKADGAEVTGSWPLSMPNVDVAGAGETVGGEAGGETVVKTSVGRDVTVTVGSTNALSLSAGTIVEFPHDPSTKWRLAVAASAAADADVKLHLQPLIWDKEEDEDEPEAVPASGIGEPIILTEGIYKGVLESTLPLTERTRYTAKVVATEGAVVGTFYYQAKAAYRTLVDE